MTTGSTKNMAVGNVGSFTVLVHNKCTPRDDEWDRYLELALRNAGPGATVRSLVVTYGGTPTITQQRRMLDLLAQRFENTPVITISAVISHSTFVQGTVTAMGWHYPGIRAFSPDKREEAFAYMGVPRAYFDDVHKLIDALKAELDPSPTGA